MRALLIALSCLLLASTAESQTVRPRSKHRPFQPVVRQDVSEYVGRYVGVDESFRVDVHSAGAGKLAVRVHKGDDTITIRDPKMDGAVLSGTIKNRDNQIEPFEAVFGVRDMNGRRSFGLLVNEQVKVDQDMITNRLFCKLVEPSQ